MKTVVDIVFNANLSIQQLRSLLSVARCGADVSEVHEPAGQGWWPWAAVALDSNDDRLSALLATLRQHEIDWTEIHRDRYSPEELMAARLVLLYANAECAIDGGPEFGTSYDLSGACSRCGTGAKQTSALIVGGEDVEKLRNATAGQTYYDDLLVHEKIAADLETAGLTGLVLHRVYESLGGTQRRLPWRHILAERTLPRMSGSTTGIIRGRVCDVCKRQAHCSTQKQPMRIVYHEKDLIDAQDVNATWEWFGYTKDDLPYPEGFVARPGILVSPKVVKILMDHGVTAFDFIPIHVETDQSKPQQ